MVRSLRLVPLGGDCPSSIGSDFRPSHVCNFVTPLCREEQLWFHVDGAYGALGILSPGLAPRLADGEVDRCEIGARRLLAHALDQCPVLGIANVLAFVFARNMPSVTLFEAYGFGRWGLLPKVCEMDGKEHDLLILGRRI